MGLGLIAMSTLLWSLWSDGPALATPISIAVPLIAVSLAAFFPDKLTLGPPEHFDHRKSLAYVFFFPMIALGLSALRQFFHLQVDALASELAAAAVIAAFTLALLCARIDSKRMNEGLWIALTTVSGAIWIGGALLNINGWIGPRTLVQSRAVAIDKYTSHGRRSESYWLDLASPPSAKPQSFLVSHLIYQQVVVGSTVCFLDKTGALHLRWWTIGPCETAPSPKGSERI
jgi:hypothetical protein